MRKRILLGFTLTTILAGICFLSIPFFGALAPSAQAKSERWAHDISNLDKGDYLIEPFKDGYNSEASVLIVKDWDGAVYAHILLLKERKVQMPEVYWGNGYYLCSDFRPEIDSNGKIVINGVITCHDKVEGIYRQDTWLWSYSGQARDKYMGDMITPEYAVSAHTLYINL